MTKVLYRTLVVSSCIMSYQPSSCHYQILKQRESRICILEQQIFLNTCVLMDNMKMF